MRVGARAPVEQVPRGEACKSRVFRGVRDVLGEVSESPLVVVSELVARPLVKAGPVHLEAGDHMTALTVGFAPAATLLDT